MANGNYKVSLGVDLRVSEIRERINQYNSNSNNAKLRLGIKLDTKGLAEQIKAIKYKTPITVAMKLDTKNVQTQINNIKKQIQQLGNIKINLGGVGVAGSGKQDIQTVRIARSVNDVTRAYRELLSIQNRMGSKQQAVAKLDTTKNKQEIAELSNQIDLLARKYQRIHQLFSGQFSTAQIDTLNRNFEITAEKLSVIKSKALDAKASLNQMSGGGTRAGTNNAASGVTRTVNELTTAYNNLRNISRNIGSIKIKLSSGLNTSKDAKQIQVIEAQLQSLTAQYHKTVAKIKGKGDLSATQWQTIQHQIDNTKMKLDQLSAKVVDAKNKLANNIKLKLSGGTFANDISNIQAKFNGLSIKSDTLRAGIDRVKLAIKDMQTAANSGSVDALTSAYQRYQVTLKSVENQLRINKNIEQQANAAEALKQSRNSFLLETNNWLQKNSAAAAEFGGRIRELQAQVNNCDKTSLARLRAEFSNVKQEAALAGKTAQTFGDRLRMQFQRYSAYFSVASVIMYSVQALRSMFEQVKAIDSAMVELKKVTNETNESYNKFLTNAAKRSKEIGTTIDGLVQSTAGFARLGYGFGESQKLAEVANIYAVVGDEVEGVEGATKSLISTMAAFKEQQSEIANEDFAMDIIDKFNEIGKLIA